MYVYRSTPNHTLFKPTTGENRQLVKDEPVEFEKQPVEVQDCRIMTNHFRRIYRIYPNLKQEKKEDVNMLPVGLSNTRISTGYAQKAPRSLIQDMYPEHG